LIKGGEEIRIATGLKCRVKCDLNNETIENNFEQKEPQLNPQADLAGVTAAFELTAAKPYSL